MRLYRQPKFGDWTAVVAAVRGELERWLTERVPGHREAA
jgi:hypothetical protein